MNNIKEFFKLPQVWGFFVSIAVMAVISIAFFYPDNFDNNILRQPDSQQGVAIGQEGNAYFDATGEKALWTNSLFGGMPTFQIAPSTPSDRLISWVGRAYGLWLPSPSNLLFMMMFGFLILLYAMRMRWYYALIGAIAWGFSSYYIILIGAGHLWKFLCLTYVPPTIGGLILAYRGRYVRGSALMALFAMLQLNANHAQMTYYFGILMGIMVICYLIDAIRRKELRRWCIATVLSIVAGGLALGANLPSLYNTYEYSKETVRSGSELTPVGGGNAESAEKPTGGMPYSQIVGWSYGRSEMFSLLIPNIKGGASARPEGGQMVAMSLDKLEDAESIAANVPILQYLSQYFNDSEGTNGPVYVGVLIFALFLLGCFIVRGPLKWALLAGTIVSVLLALGRNAEGITDFMIYHFPLYSKFRAVESILVIAEFTIPLLAIMALATLVEKIAVAWRVWRRPILISFGVPALICAAAVVMPGVFGDPITSSDRSTSEQVQKQIKDYAQSSGVDESRVQSVMYQYSLLNKANYDAVRSLRLGMVRSDGLRSLFILLLGFGFLYMFMSGKIKRGVTLGAVGALVLFDLYGVDKRYVSHSSFCPPDSENAQIVFTPDAVDKMIMADTTSHYRVLDIPGFWQADRSYFHKMIGGYHAAKLKRYDDIIQRRLNPVLQIGFFPDDPALNDPKVAEIAGRLRSGYAVADMLNTRYVITGDAKRPVVLNPHALGNAWLVDEVKWVDGADSEMAALDATTLDVSHQAVADRRFSGMLPQQSTIMPGDTIYLTSYTPNTLTYHASTTNGGIGVFSEVYFPWGWHADIDGKPADIARVNYVLRAMALPAGDHTITMRFEPASLRVTSGIAYACITLIYLIALAGLFAAIPKCLLP